MKTVTQYRVGILYHDPPGFLRQPGQPEPDWEAAPTYRVDTSEDVARARLRLAVEEEHERKMEAAAAAEAGELGSYDDGRKVEFRLERRTVKTTDWTAL